MNHINDVRTALFNQLERLSDPNCNLEKEVLRANAIVDVTKTLIDSAKVEVAYMQVSGLTNSDFIPQKTLGAGKEKKHVKQLKDGNS